MKYIEGVNNMNQIKTFRKLAIFVLILAGLLTLAACGSSEKIPYGSITDDNYMTLGDVTVTEKELYNQLRLQGASVLATMVDEQIFADELAAAIVLLAGGDVDANEYLDETINTAIHGTAIEEQLDEIFTDYNDRWSRNIEQFADSLYLLDNTIDRLAVIASLESMATPGKGYSALPLLVERYGLRVAQRNFAEEILAVEVTDEEDASYISEANVVTYYKANKEGQYDVDALVVRFINLNEANAALYLASIKADSKGLWYKIPDIRILSGEEGYVDLNDLTPSGYGHVKTILSDLGLLGKLGVDYEDRDQLSIADYENYYKNYVISTSRDNGLRDEALTSAQVKQEFVNIYNILNPASQIEVAVDGSIVGVGLVEYSTTFTYEDLTDINTSLRSHIYTTLTAEATMTDPNDVTEGKSYSSRVQTFGTSRYLVYKLNDESATEEGILIADPEDEDLEIFADTPAAVAVRDEMYAELLDSKLTSTYISEKVNELYEAKELNIYDSVVRAFYEQSYGYEGSTKDQSGDIVAEIDGIEITVDTFFDRLEKSYGINLALDIASNKYLLNESGYEVTAEDLDDYTTQFEDIISQFSADNFASAGYPASMGRTAFLLLAFGATTNTEAINQLYVYPNLRQQYLEDMELHYGTEGYTVYEKLADLAALQYTNFESINVSHLLVYIDENGDGTPDDPQEYLDKLDLAGQTQVLEGLADLVETIYTIVGDYKGMAEGLSAIATEFNNSGRIERGSLIAPIDYQIEVKWSEFRQLGFYLKYETISSSITNTSNLITGSSVLDPVFYDRAMVLHDQLAEMDDEDSKFPLLDLYGTVITQEALENVKSGFGWHLILATSVKETTSAIYSATDDEDGKYESEDGLLNAYNESSDTLTPSQIEFYLTEQKTDEGVVLPTEVQTAFTNYFTPVITRYQNTYMQRELVFKLLEDADFSVANGNARFTAIREINRRQLSEYLLSAEGVYDQNYANLYGTWFDILESGI
jgi:hypothetical protein